MNEAPTAVERAHWPTLTGAQAAGLAVAATSVIVLLWSRLAHLDQSMWHDEAYTVLHFVGPGPSAIFSTYSTNDHMLFSLLTWLTTHLGGTHSEIAYRFWSVGPALVAGIGLSYWLARRLGAVAGVAFLVLWCVNAELADVVRQARGYGLTFAAMALLLAAGHTLLRDPANRKAAVSVAAGATIGVLTLPVFVLPAAAALTVLAATPRTRRPAVLAGAVSAALSLLWYLPVLSQLVEQRTQKFGRPYGWSDVLLEPVRQLDLPGPGTPQLRDVWVLLVVALLAAGVWRIAQRDLAVAALWVLPTLGTLAALTALHFYVLPRFVSYLFVPSAVLAAAGCQLFLDAAVRDRSRLSAPAARTLLVTAGVMLLAMGVPSLDQAAALPEENYKAAAQYAATRTGPILTNSTATPGILVYNRGRDVEITHNDEIEVRTCTPPPEGLVVIDYPWENRPLDVRCLVQHGADHARFRQAAAGGFIDVWALPPAAQVVATAAR